MQNPAKAWNVHGLPAASPAAGFSQTGTSANDFFGGALNAINNANQLSFANGADPSFLDANGYPGVPLTSTQQIAMAIGFVGTQTGSGTQWVFKWTPAGDAVWFLNGGWSNITATGCTATSNTFTTTVTMTAGTPARVTFNWSSPPGGNLLTQFKAANYAPGSPQMVLCRASDEAAITAGQIFTPEYLAVMAALNLRTLRFMVWINSGNLANTNQSLWKYRSTLSMMGWGNGRWPPGAWGGTISGTNQYTVALPPDSSAAGWVNGEVIQGNVTNATTTSAISITGAVNNGSGLIRLTVSASGTLTTNQQVFISGVSGTYEANGVQTLTVIDSTHVDLQGSTFVHTYAGGTGTIGVETLTVTGKTGGTVPIATTSATALHAPFLGSVGTGPGTFIYDAVLGAVMYSGGPITANIPIEAAVNLVNALNINLWTNLPIFADNSYATSEAALIRDSLKSALCWYPEVSNEVWATSWPQTAYSINKGALLGGISGHGFYSLRVRQIMGAITTTWTATRSQSTLNRLIAWQAFGDSTVTTQRLNSSELNTASNPQLLAYAGSVNYTVQGQRASDWCDVGSYATYFSGALFTNGFATGYQSDAGAVTQIQNLANLFNANASDPTAFAIVDNDFRQGTVQNNTISSVSGTTINATANGLSTNQRGVFTNTGGALYTGVSLNTPYFVVSAATNSFSVSLTRGGAAISLSGGSGTNSFGILAGQTMLDLSQIIYQNTGGNLSSNPGWEAVAATYDTYRNSVSQPLLKIECYEGALEALAPTTAQCTAMGVLVGGSASTASAALTAGLAAYKNSSLAKALALSQFRQFKGEDASQPLTFGLMAHSKTPSWFLTIGPSQWSLLPGSIDSTPYQTYNGVAAFNG